MCKRILTFILVLMFALPAFADSSFFIVSPNSAPVNVRDEPSTKGLIILHLITGTQIEVIDSNGYWTHIRVGDTEGYVQTKYITSNDPYQETTDPQKVDEEEETVVIRYIQSPNSAPVNLRYEASRQSRIISKLITGTEVEVIENDGTWVKIVYNGQEGYVLSEYIVETKPRYINKNDSIILYVQSDNSFPINLRDKPGGQIVTRLLTGTEVYLISADEEWAYVTTGYTEGYIMVKYLVPTLPGVIDRSYTAYAFTESGNDVRVRYGAGKGYDTVCFLPSGTELTVLGSVLGWARIRCGEVEGFIDEQYITSELDQ